jgi:phosphoenolpyruvate carboxykinase (ATP)
MTYGYRPDSPGRPGSSRPGSRPGSPYQHTKVEEELHTMAGIDYDKVIRTH